MTKLHTEVPGGTIPLFVPSSMKRLRSFVVSVPGFGLLVSAWVYVAWRARPGHRMQCSAGCALLVVLRLLADSDLAVV